MRVVAAVALALAVPSVAQGHTSQPMPSGAARMPGIVDRTPPGTTRVPGIVSVRIAPGDPVVSHDLREAYRNIERRRDNGELSKREARRLKREVQLTARLSAGYSHDGLSEAERRELRLRASTLLAQSGAPPVPTRQR